MAPPACDATPGRPPPEPDRVSRLAGRNRLSPLAAASRCDTAGVSSFIVSAMRLRAGSTYTTRTLTTWPVLTAWRASFMNLALSWLTCTRPS